jgi:arylamine N-acetyltransferase
VLIRCASIAALVPLSGGTSLPDQDDTLTPDLLDRVLAKLGFSHRPAPTLQGLQGLYGAWCLKVPFDNVRKLIALRQPSGGPLPGDDAADFFDSWLRYGSGGTCWAANGALHALLAALGYAPMRGIATMLVSPHAPPNHGTVCVPLEGKRYLVDASILHGLPLELPASSSGEIEHAAWGVRAVLRQEQWSVSWRPLHVPTGVECRIEMLGTTAAAFHDMHEKTRVWSPFNYQLYARRNRSGGVIGTAFGKRVEFDAAGAMAERALPAGERRRFLIEEIGIDEALLSALPADMPTPPPPWVRHGAADAGRIYP